jgi:hypothetical protein
MGDVATPPIEPPKPPAGAEDHQQAPATRAKRGWSADEIVVASFAFLGVGVGAFLSLRPNVPPITASILLATGLAALAYRYLGGVEGSSFSVGALKLTGALAALVGIALLINSKLSSQVLPRYQAWEVSGQVIDEKTGQPFDYDPSHQTEIVLQPSMLQPPSAQGKFTVEIISSPDINQKQTFPTLSVSRDGYATHFVDLNPNAASDIKIQRQGQLIQLLDRLVLQPLPPYQPPQVELKPASLTAEGTSPGPEHTP